MIEKHELGRARCGDLAGKLAADGAAGPGHQHAPAADELSHGPGVKDLAWASQKILDRHGQRPVHSREAFGVSLAELGQPGKPRKGHALGFGDGKQRPQLVAVDALVGQHEALGPAAGSREPVDDLGGLAHLGQHRHALDLPTGAAARPVEDAEHGEGRDGAAHGADEALGRIPRPHQEHRHGQGIPPLQHMPQISVMEQAIGDARSAQQKDQHEPVDQQSRARIAREPVGQEQDGEEDENGDADGPRDCQEIGERGIAPDTAVEAGEQEHHRRFAGEHPDAIAQEGLAEGNDADPEPDRQRERDSRHEHVMGERHARLRSEAQPFEGGGNCHGAGRP